MKKYISVILLAAVLLNTGCTSRDLPLESTVAIGTDDMAAAGNNDISDDTVSATTELGTYAMTEIAWESDVVNEPVVLDSPPDMRIEARGDMIASCMTMAKCGYTWGNEGEQVIACGASPYQAWEHGDVHAVINILDLAASPKVLLTNGAEIEYVRCWGGDDGYQEINFTADGEIIIPQLSTTGNVYEVSIVFPQGRCSYVFATEKRAPYSGDEGNSEGATSPAYDPTAVQTSAAYIPENELCGYPLAEDMQG